ncbi:hypothetical protein B0A48_10387 [Cryoendolithus antarcticus]|uniref:SET domain-containing protein n=1 Tax=Cryoendolithus antarcticus TaxID=1507870 RepID=A0A1V8SXT8_9PEZI|nr:hypothetical protein B0A48_10387 [Cryoendolithus antarcticus]
MTSEKSMVRIDLCMDSEEDEKTSSVPAKKISVTRAPSKPGRASRSKQASSDKPAQVIDLTGDAEETSQSAQKRNVLGKPHQIDSSKRQAKSDIDGSLAKRSATARPSNDVRTANANEFCIISDDDAPTKKNLARVPRPAFAPTAPILSINQSTRKRARDDEAKDRMSSPPSKRARRAGSDAKFSTETPRKAVSIARDPSSELPKAFTSKDARPSTGFRTARDIANQKAQAEIEKSRRVRQALAGQMPVVRGNTNDSLQRTTKVPDPQSITNRDSARKITESPDASSAPAASSPVATKPRRTCVAHPKAVTSTPNRALKTNTPSPGEKRPSDESLQLRSSPRKHPKVSAPTILLQKSPSTNEAVPGPDYLQGAKPEAAQPEVQTNKGHGDKQESAKIGFLGTLKANFSALMGPPKAKASSSIHALPGMDALQDHETATTSALAPSTRRTKRDPPNSVPDTNGLLHVMTPIPDASSESNATPAPSITTAAPIETTTSMSTPVHITGRPVTIQLTLLQQVEQTLEKYAAEMRADTGYTTKAMLKRARSSASCSATDLLPGDNAVASSIFARLPAMPLFAVSANAKTPADSVRVNVETSIGKASVKSHYLVKPTICDTSEVVDVPGYTHYVSLEGNILAPNVLHMNVWPYFGDEYVKEDTFGQLYHVDTADRERKLRRLLQTQRAEEYANSALEDLGITWSDVLHFLLDRNWISIAGLHDSMKRAVSKAATFRSEDFPSRTGDGDKWVYVLSYVSSKSKPEFLGKAALLSPADPGQDVPKETDDAEPGMEEDPAVATDLVHPERVNRRKRMSFLPTPDSDKKLSLPVRPPMKKKTAWDPNTFAKLEERSDSGVHGMGLYAGEAIRADEFIGEYVGEVITTNEGERRGAVYEHQFLSYLFSLNKTQEVDATYYGNEMRFMNHRPKNAANVYPRVKLVNTVHRIALYGQRPIKPGEELFFDYGPQFPEKSLKGEEKVGNKDPVAASAPHVRNKNLVSNFYDVEDTEDAAGNVIARKAASARRPKGKAPNFETATPKRKPQGGARPGAGRKPAMPDVALPDVLVAPSPAPGADDGEMLDARASPGHRLSAYYTSDDKIVDAAAEEDAKDDEDFDPDASGDEVGGAQGASGSSGESEAAVETPEKRRRGRPKKYTR